MSLNLSSIPIVDHHCHSLLRHAGPFNAREFQRFFTESGDEVIRAEHVPNTVFFRWAIKELAAFFGCAPTTEAVLAARAVLSPAEVAARMFRDANIPLLLVDYGYQGGETYTHDELKARLPCRIEPVLRLETMAQDLMLRHDTFDQMVEAFIATVEGARAAGYVALKSIIAYRTGLAIRETSRAEAAESFGPVKEQARREGKLRLATKPLNDYLVLRALDVAEKQGLPIQFHTGFGDSDVDLLQANPLLMRPLFQSGNYVHVPFIILHAGYPYVRELGYLAALYANVFMDVSLAIPFVAGDIPALLSQVLGLTPTSKVLFSTDAYSIPEIFWIAARWGRWGLARVLDDLMAAGALDEAEALTAARQILGENAARVYQVKL
jgi:predicted TIM-barrel fold metal-dependent hydrolase